MGVFGAGPADCLVLVTLCRKILSRPLVKPSGPTCVDFRASLTRPSGFEASETSGHRTRPQSRNKLGRPGPLSDTER